MPASETSVWPVIQCASSEARKAMAAQCLRLAHALDRRQHLDEAESLLVRARLHALGVGQPRRHGIDGDLTGPSSVARARVKVNTPPLAAT